METHACMCVYTRAYACVWAGTSIKSNQPSPSAMFPITKAPSPCSPGQQVFPQCDFFSSKPPLKFTLTRSHLHTTFSLFKKKQQQHSCVDKLCRVTPFSSRSHLGMA